LICISFIASSICFLSNINNLNIQLNTCKSSTHHIQQQVDQQQPVIIQQSVDQQPLDQQQPVIIQQQPSLNNMYVENQLPSLATQGFEDYGQVGILSANNKVLPLYGRRSLNGSHKWNYYTSTDAYHKIDIPVMNKNRDCGDEYGCDELNTDDSLFVPALNQHFSVQMYKRNKYVYVA
jgi:hypothetical protein